MAIIFTDKNGRTVVVRSRKRDRDTEESKEEKEDVRGPSAEEIVLGLLSKVPQSEFLRLPTKVIE